MPHDDRMNISRSLSRLLAPLQAIALALGVVVASAASTASADVPSRTHVYLFNGILGVFFSTGVTKIADQLRTQGIEASVYGPSLWLVAAKSAAEDYRKGRVDTIVLVGYSAGTRSINHAIFRLSKEGIPVKLAVGLDPLEHEAVYGHVGRYINFYNPGDDGKPIARGPQFSGVIQNVNVSSIPGINHVNIDDNAAIRAKIISAIHAGL